jgi:hypothetical protein
MLNVSGQATFLKPQILVKNNWSICEILLQRLASNLFILFLLISQIEVQQLPTGFPRQPHIDKSQIAKIREHPGF